MKIYTFHLLNDFSGSPKVLKNAVEAWVKAGHEVTMVHNANSHGFLSDLAGVEYHHFNYRLWANKGIRLAALIWSQVYIILSLFAKVKKEDLIYINTVLPFGAAILAYLKGCRVVYHLHETSVKPLIFKRFLFACMNLFADEVIYVSQYLAKQEPAKNAKTHIQYNALEQTFLEKALTSKKPKNKRKKVLMVCSLKSYKGVDEFVHLAKRCSEFDFELVLNANQEAIANYFDHANLPSNLIIHPTQTDLHPFYSTADCLLNLSRPDGWVETFGLTVLEAMAYQLPVIVPPVGGVTELVEDGVNGYRVDSRDFPQLVRKLRRLLKDRMTYKSMRKSALLKARFFSQDMFEFKSLCIVEGQCPTQFNRYAPSNQAFLERFIETQQRIAV
jgi:glycosyltransferase involved in cell wall biosynthesis